jgi:hypothetical protein
MDRQAAKEVYVLDRTFGLVGRLDGVSIDPEGGAWANVDFGGLFSSLRRLAPLHGAQWWSGYLLLTCSRRTVRTAPEPAGSLLLQPIEASVLRAHYALDAT